VPKVAEFLSALRYLSKGNVKKRRAELFSRGVAADIINAPGSAEDVANIMRAKFESRAAPDFEVDLSEPSQPLIENLPWMFQLTIRKMTRDLCRLPFNIDEKYYGEFLQEYRTRIKAVYACLSYTPWGRIFEGSGFDFSHLHNVYRPPFFLKYHGPKDKPESVRRDLGKSLDRLTANVAPDGPSKKKGKSLEERLNVTRTRNQVNFVYNPEIRVLAGRSQAGEHDEQYRNAWLFEVASDDPLSEEASFIVGFIDNFMPGKREVGTARLAGEDPFSVPLSLEDASKLVGTLWE
jgi:hypothetical protein